MKTAFITGASRGIGEGIARALARDGYNLAMVCIHSKEKLEALAQELRETYNIRTLTYIGDVADSSFVMQAGQDMLQEWGHIDVLINNAGIAHIELITDMSVEEWNRMLSVNLSSCFYTTKAFVPSMIHNHHGSIINISSMWGSVGASCEAAYSAAKGGLNIYTRALAKELAPSGIQVNAIACGVIDTEMNAMLSEEEKQDLIDDIPACRMGTPEDVGNTVVSMLHASDYLTGQIIGLDGGYL